MLHLVSYEVLRTEMVEREREGARQRLARSLRRSRRTT